MGCHSSYEVLHAFLADSSTHETHYLGELASKNVIYKLMDLRGWLDEIIQGNNNLRLRRGVLVEGAI